MKIMLGTGINYDDRLLLRFRIRCFRLQAIFVCPGL